MAELNNNPDFADEYITILWANGETPYDSLDTVVYVMYNYDGETVGMPFSDSIVLVGTPLVGFTEAEYSYGEDEEEILLIKQIRLHIDHEWFYAVEGRSGINYSGFITFGVKLV